VVCWGLYTGIVSLQLPVNAIRCTNEFISATLQPLSGKFYTHFNSKAVFLIFVFVFEMGSLICGVASFSVVLIVGRAVAGLGGAGIVNGAMTILSGVVPREKSPGEQR
jgi:MFS family permease